jgi:hypothetical protein
MRDVRSRARLAALAVPFLVACPNQELAPLEPCTVSGLNVDTAQDSVDRVDLLFMVDNSGSMAEEQLKLAAKLSRLVLVLTSGDKEAGKPAPRDYPDRFFPPARSLHLGLVTSDLGRPPGTAAIGTCNDQSGLPVGGGVLQHSTTQAVQGILSESKAVLVPPDQSCAVAVPTYIDFGVAGAPYADPATAAAHFQCVAKVGIGGCGVEQQIAASLKALLPSSLAIFGAPDRGGQGDRANAGFLRNDSVLAVLMVSDEDDCSITDTPDGARMFTEMPINTRCQLEYRDRPDTPALHKPQDLAKSLVGLRGATPERFVLGGIVGLPLASAGVKYDDPAALLGHPDMQVSSVKDDIVPACREVVDPAVPRPSGVAPGDAKPGRRFVELAREVKALGGDAILRSICEADYGEALDQLIAKIAKQLRGPCLPRELPLDKEGLVACGVVEILALGSVDTCAAPGREPDGTRSLPGDPPNSPEHTACKLTQFAPTAVTPSTAGWFYDTSADTVADCSGLPRIQFTDALAVRPGALTRVECFRYAPRVAPNTRGFAALNTPCTPSAVGCLSKADAADLALPSEPLVCEPLSQTCQIPCLVDAQCPEGYVCSEAAVRTCQNPTCLAGGG